MINTAWRIIKALQKYGTKAYNVIKKGGQAMYDSFMAAKAKGWTHAAWWLVEHGSTLGTFYDLLKAAGLID
ncbi:hypothetical protein ILS68_27510 [Bacillus sp. 8YEL33]|uniref:hypothetical protein n=1 Tax=Bacillus TaxID=1386 RepID=UPI0018A149BE|nr:MULTISPECIES: hypothetical protein [Bacillus]MBF7150676.1 hypothetical protein [Bacillus toyonensis]MBY7104972.1 hypothetical protein [Bacillus sp. 6YEL31]MBY7131319.1 hypothetical protein [Bacillus sp. 8YEL33]MEC2348186.1 hypothetical protein [Bacillus toyonensis]MED3188639.1 hypothetical protein [Bacillus toyonensis]